MSQLRVAVIGPDGPDALADNIVFSLREMGLQAYPVGSVLPRLQRPLLHGVTQIAFRTSLPNRLAQQRLIRRVSHLQAELVITVDASLLPETVIEMQRNGAKVLLWFPDHISNLDRQLLFLTPYDAIFSKEPRLVSRLREVLGIQAYYLPEACNPAWHYPPADEPCEPYIAVVGNFYPSRIRLLDRLDAAGVPLRLYGSPFPRWVASRPIFRLHTGVSVHRERKASVFRNSLAVLNNLHPSELDGVNNRLFEATACGAAVLTEMRPALPELFDIDSEVLAFSTYDELLEEIHALLADETLGRKLGDAATKRAHADHTYRHRLTRLLETVL